MSILIIDPSKHYRDIAAELVCWVDRRHKIDFANDGASAWTMAGDLRPKIVLCEPSLPDGAGADLCRRLRERYPQTSYIAYADSKHEIEGFDARLNKPPSRLEVLSVLTEAKKRVKSLRLDKMLDDETSRRHRPDVRQSGRIDIVVCLVEEQDMKFTVSVPLGATVAEVIHQLGKHQISWFSMLRRGRNAPVYDTTVVSAGDELLFRL